MTDRMVDMINDSKEIVDAGGASPSAGAFSGLKVSAVRC